MKIGINMNCYGGGLPIDEQLRLMKENGFEATFLGCEGASFDETVEKIQAAGITVDNLHAPFNKINDMWLPGDAGEDMLARLVRCVEKAASHGIPVIVVHVSSGNRPPIINDIGNDRFARLMEAANANNVTVAYENQRKLANLALMFEYYDEAGFCWDIGHEACFANGREFMPLFGDKLVALHVQDNNCEYNVDSHLVPYDGKIDFDKAARMIAARDYKGTVMLELIRKNSNRYDDLTPEQYYKRAANAAIRLRDAIEGYRTK